MAVYPQKVCIMVDALMSVSDTPNEPDAVGVAAALECGTSIRFSLDIDEAEKKITAIRVRSNGCGFMLAAAGAIKNSTIGKSLTELHGSNARELIRGVESEIGELAAGRRHCAATAIDALHTAFADYRSRRVEEFSGERALICTCFGISEDTIEEKVATAAATSVSEIGRLTRAGTGCGSCQMLIQEIIDSSTDDML
jgi:NifU-like protein